MTNWNRKFTLRTWQSAIFLFTSTLFLSLPCKVSRESVYVRLICTRRLWEFFGNAVGGYLLLSVSWWAWRMFRVLSAWRQRWRRAAAGVVYAYTCARESRVRSLPACTLLPPHLPHPPAAPRRTAHIIPLPALVRTVLTRGPSYQSGRKHTAVSILPSAVKCVYKIIPTVNCANFEMSLTAGSKKSFDQIAHFDSRAMVNLLTSRMVY